MAESGQVGVLRHVEGIAVARDDRCAQVDEGGVQGARLGTRGCAGCWDADHAGGLRKGLFGSDRKTASNVVGACAIGHAMDLRVQFVRESEGVEGVDEGGGSVLGVEPFQSELVMDV